MVEIEWREGSGNWENEAEDKTSTYKYMVQSSEENVNPPSVFQTLSTYDIYVVEWILEEAHVSSVFQDPVTIGSNSRNWTWLVDKYFEL